MKKKGINPKDKLGTRKVPLDLLPPAGLIHEAMAMKEGGLKYGPFNWRNKPVRNNIYIAAAMRHLLAYADGEDYTTDQKVRAHHLGAVMASCAIVLDAAETGNLVDTRPTKGAAPRLLAELAEKKPKQQKRRK